MFFLYQLVHHKWFLCARHICCIASSFHMGYLTEKEEETKEKETEGKSQSCGATGGDMAETDDADEGTLSWPFLVVIFKITL